MRVSHAGSWLPPGEEAAALKASLGLLWLLADCRSRPQCASKIPTCLQTLATYSLKRNET